MDLSVEWPSSSCVRASSDCHDTVASTASSSLNNTNLGAAMGGGELSSSVASPYCHTRRQLRQHQLALQEQHKKLTQEIIQLKCNIATQRGRQDELLLDWQKLSPERNAMQLEIESIECECNTIRTEISHIEEQIKESNIRLFQFASTESPEQHTIDQVTNEYATIDAEIQSLQQEKLSIQQASKYLSDEIEECKRNAACLSSEISEIDIDRIAVQFDIDDLHEAISRAKISIQECKSTTNELEAQLVGVKADCVKLEKYNRGLETKVCAGRLRKSNLGGEGELR